MTAYLQRHQRWIFCVAALAVWVAWGWPVLERLSSGETLRGEAVSPDWLVPYGIFGAAVLAAMALPLRRPLLWGLLGVQVAAVAAMAIFVPWAGMSSFLVITAWQVSMQTGPRGALMWIGGQTLVIIGALAQHINPDLCWVVTESVALQLVLFLAAQALRSEAETARTLTKTNRELRAAQAIIANNVRDAERLRISRELHDAWGHELTALGLQLEIASHVDDRSRSAAHVQRAKGLAAALLTKVRDVVSTLRDAERADLKDALDDLARTVPSPAIHVAIAPEVVVTPDQAHALIRCAQEAVTNAVKHADAANMWLDVTTDAGGIRLVARNDGEARPNADAPGSGLVGMRERLESLGGRLAVTTEKGLGFIIEAWLPARTAKTA